MIAPTATIAAADARNAGLQMVMNVITGSSLDVYAISVFWLMFPVQHGLLDVMDQNGILRFGEDSAQRRVVPSAEDDGRRGIGRQIVPMFGRIDMQMGGHLKRQERPGMHGGRVYLALHDGVGKVDVANLALD